MKNQHLQAIATLPKVCTVDQLFRWAQRSSAHIGTFLDDLDNDAQTVLDKLWDGPEPRPPVAVVATIMFAPAVAGMPEDMVDAWITMVLPMCSLPAIARQVIWTDLEQATFRLDDNVQVVVHDQ